MDTIKIKKDGLPYRVYWYYDDEKDVGNYREKPIESLISYLMYPLEVEEGVTFEQFFNLIMKERNLMSIVFASHLGNFSLDNWVDEWKKDSVQDEYEYQKMEKLCVQWAVQRWRDHNINGEEFLFDDNIEEYVDFHGYGDCYSEFYHKDDNGEWQGKWFKSGIAIEFTPIYKLKNYPFEVDTSWQLFDFGADDKDNFILKSTKKMSVYDVIGSVLNEISFAGNPENRDKEVEQLNKCVDDLDKLIEDKGIDNALKDGDLISADDVIYMLKDKINKKK